MNTFSVSKLNKLVAVSAVIFAACSASPVFAAGPQIGGVMPTTVTAGEAATLSASVSTGVAIDYCHLYVDLEDVGAMNVANGVASAQYTFLSGGSRVAFVFCKDANGLAAGPNTAIWVNGAIQNQPPMGGGSNNPPSTPSAPTTPSGPSAGSLIKLECAANAGADDVCKAVYYVAKDGKRHAFPNSKVFFSWYQNFDSVQTVSVSVMGSFMLGKNVTYRPGSRMVKFTTDPKVYVVSKGGQLQWVTTEAVAIGLYGTDWNTKIDDIPDTFYSNYSFGSDISDVTAFNVTAQMNGALTIDDSL